MADLEQKLITTGRSRDDQAKQRILELERQLRDANMRIQQQPPPPPPAPKILAPTPPSVAVSAPSPGTHQPQGPAAALFELGLTRVGYAIDVPDADGIT